MRFEFDSGIRRSNLHLMFWRWVRAVKGMATCRLRGVLSNVKTHIFAASPRKQVAHILIATCFVYLLCHIFGNPFVGTDSYSELRTDCDSLRSRLYGTIDVPAAPDRRAISELWISLETIFKDNPPHPEKLEKKRFGEKKDNKEFPSAEEIRSHTHISARDASACRDSHVAITRGLTSYPQSLFAKKGIVMLAGGRYSGFAPTGLGMLRETGSTLPVEVWMKDPVEERRGWCQELQQEGMACRFLSDYMDVGVLKHGYQYKIFTILFSGFEQVLFLDADNVPVQNPDTVFASEAFTSTGAVLWPDYWKSTSMPELPFIIGLSDGATTMLEDERTVESGQVAWDKSRHWKSLLLATYYNYYGPQVYYTLITQGWAGWGDKDTFPMALRSLRQKYSMIDTGELKTLFVDGTVHGIGMLQADPSNLTHYQPMFMHSNIVKWSVREFFCVGCASDAEEPITTSLFENPGSAIHSHLKEHRRIFNIHDMQGWGIDPEPMMWRVMEQTACRSVRKNKKLCKRVRKHMEKAFGFSFRTGRMTTFTGRDNPAC